MDSVKAAALDLAQVESLLNEAIAKKALIESDISILSTRRSELLSEFKVGDIVENLQGEKVLGRHKILAIRPSIKMPQPTLLETSTKDGSESKVRPQYIWVRHNGGYLRLVSDHSQKTVPLTP